VKDDNNVNRIEKLRRKKESKDNGKQLNNTNLAIKRAMRSLQQVFKDDSNHIEIRAGNPVELKLFEQLPQQCKIAAKGF